MKVGVSGVESVRGDGAVPTAAVGLHGGEGGSGDGAVPMMKFMGGNFPSGGAEQILLLGPEGHIAEPGQLAGIKACPRQKAYIGKFPIFSVRYMNPPHSAIQGRPLSRALFMDERMDAFSLRAWAYNSG